MYTFLFERDVSLNKTSIENCLYQNGKILEYIEKVC